MLSKYIETVKDKTGLEVALEIISYRFLEDGSCKCLSNTPILLLFVIN